MAVLFTQIWQDDYPEFKQSCYDFNIEVKHSTQYGYYHLINIEGTLDQMERVDAMRQKFAKRWRDQHSWLRLTFGPFFGFQNIY